MENKNKHTEEQVEVDGVLWRRIYRPDRTLQCEAPFVNGKSTGTLRTFFDNGQTELEFEYFEGVMHGKARGFRKNGELVFEKEYINGEAA
jgi:antitoxin component YwqK of YwqJK toxin-antitoxin module